jgi:hypothetical protein
MDGGLIFICENSRIVPIQDRFIKSLQGRSSQGIMRKSVSHFFAPMGLNHLSISYPYRVPSGTGFKSELFQVAINAEERLEEVKRTGIRDAYIMPEEY